jgi:membrane fusion protein, multidrug efflux system
MKNNPFSIRNGAVMFLAAVMLVGLLGPGCSNRDKAKSQRDLKIPVVTAQAEQKNIPVQLTSIGSVEAISSIAIKSQVGGILSQVHFQEGQDVNAGDMLFTIEPTYYHQMLNEAEAALRKDKAQLANARVDMKRYEDLIKRDLISRQQYDQAHTQVEVLKASVGADQAAVGNANLFLSYCSIKSPLTGRTGSLTAHVGDLVKAGDANAMITINQLQPIYVTFVVPDQYLPEIKKYMATSSLKVYAALQNQTAAPESGALTFVDNAVDKTTGNIKLKATFENADKTLWPGQFVNVSLDLTDRPNSVVVPSQAVLSGQSGQYIYVVKSDLSVEPRPVTTGITYQNYLVVEKGLSAGEKVVIDGQLQLFPGAKVEVKPQSGSTAGVKQGSK